MQHKNKIYGYYQLIIIIIIIGFACTQKTTQVILTKTKNQTTCDTLNYNYSTKINKIINKNCISCHNADSYLVDLSNYNVLMPFIKSGKLYKHINGVRGFAQMPQDEKLSDCDINVIRVWIKNGYKND